MTLAQLHFIDAVAQYESFSRAARACNVTQPTLSNGISKIEEELGQPIFFRSTRNVTITQFGENILPSIQSMIELEKLIHHRAKEFLNPEKVVLQIGLSPLINTKFLGLLLSSFKAKNKNHEVILIEQNLKVLDEKLKSGELDIIIAPKIGAKKDKKTIQLYEENLYLVGQLGTKASQVPIGDIRDKTFVMVPDSCGLSEITRSILRSTSKDFKEYEGKAMTYQVLADWASNGLGFALLPESKISLGIQKTMITKQSRPIKIVFEAKWKTNQKKTKLLVKYLYDNSKKIYSGLERNTMK